jgi:hypothetical protein
VKEKGVHSLGFGGWVEEIRCYLDCCECLKAYDSLIVDIPVSYETDGSSDRTVHN